MKKKISGAGTATAIIAALALALVLKLFVFDFMVIDGSSMYPTLRSGSVEVVNRLAYGLRLPWTGRYALRWTFPKQGDIVVFYTPAGDIAVKRCDFLTLKAEFVKPNQRAFMALGDNSLESYDSRAYGPVSVDAVIGKVMWRN